MGKTQDEIWRRKWIQNNVHFRLIKGLSLAMITCQTFLYFLVGTLQLNRKIHIQKLKLFRIRASLLTHSGSSEAARNAARRKAHTSTANPARISEMSVIWNFFGDIGLSTSIEKA